MSYTAAKFLRNQGVDAHVFVLSGEVNSYSSNPLKADAHPGGDFPQWVHPWSGKLSIFRDYPLFKNFDVIEGGTIVPVILQFLVSDFIAYANGADLKEFASQPSLAGYLQRRAYRKARMIRFGDVTMLRWMEQFGLRQGRFVPCIMDVESYRREEAPVNTSRNGGHLTLFHAARLDWTDTSGRRHSLKRNDLFIRAFARFIKDGNSAELRMVDWGVDRQETRELIESLGISEKVTMLPQMDKQSLIDQYYEADIVVDQFFIGSPGLVSLEAMACKKPVICYFDNECAKVCYEGDVPPVMNAKTEEEIFLTLCKLNDETLRESVGKVAQAWIRNHHHGDVVAQKLLSLYQGLK